MSTNFSFFLSFLSFSPLPSPPPLLPGPHCGKWTTSSQTSHSCRSETWHGYAAVLPLFSGRRITLMPPLLPVGPGHIPTLFLDTVRGAFKRCVSIMLYPFIHPLFTLDTLTFVTTCTPIYTRYTHVYVRLEIHLTHLTHLYTPLHSLPTPPNTSQHLQTPPNTSKHQAGVTTGA